MNVECSVHIFFFTVGVCVYDCRYSASLPPVQTVASGDVVHLYTVSGDPGNIPGKAVQVQVGHISLTPRVESARFELLEITVLSSHWFQLCNLRPYIPETSTPSLTAFSKSGRCSAASRTVVICATGSDWSTLYN